MKDIWENVETFEKLVADYSGSKYAVAVDSCTNAIFLSVKYCKKNNIHSNKLVNVPTQTYVSIPQQVIHGGYKVNFIDLKWSGCYKLDPLPIIDSAQRFTNGMYIKDTFYCLSFNYKKILSTGRGGMILTDNKDAYLWFKKMRDDGRVSLMYDDLINLNCDEIGYHMYMTPDQACRGIQDFYRINFYNEDRATNDDYRVDLSKLKCFNENS